MNDKCPQCEKSDGLWRDEVDIGVGIQYGPYRCDHCGWAEDSDTRTFFTEADE